MDVISNIFDRRINSWNLYVESSFGEYLEFANQIIKNNELQRKRVKTSKTIYSLLKNDLKKGCIMPPLVLALANTNQITIRDVDGNKLLDYIKQNVQNVLILDGLQRTYTLIDAEEEMRDKEEYNDFLNNKLRIEFYIDINKFGVLYRMLTLNTGQTPMSARHQIEMLYSDMLNKNFNGIKLVTEKDGKADSNNNEFIFKNTIEGFNSYMNRNELPLDRQDILDNVKMLENMSSEKISEDLFEEFLDIYIKVFMALRQITNDYVVKKEELQEYQISESPFGNNVSKIFSSSQAFTGFGAAVGKMNDLKVINSLGSINEMINELKNRNSGYDWMMEMLVKLDKIKISSKKIGNAQRMFFQYFFRELFNKESDSYLNLENAVNNGYNKYYSQVS